MSTRNSASHKTLEIESPKKEREEPKDQVAVKSIVKRSRKMTKSRRSNRESLEGIKSSPKKQRKLDENIDCFALQRTTSFGFLGLAQMFSSNSKSGQETYSPETSESEEADDREKPEDGDKFVRPKVIKCDYCAKVFFSRIVYRRHALKHVKIIRCGICNKPFKNIFWHRRHEIDCRKHNRIQM